MTSPKSVGQVDYVTCNRPGFHLSSRRKALPTSYTVAKARGAVQRKGTPNYSHTMQDGGLIGYGPLKIEDDDDLEAFYGDIARDYKRCVRGDGPPLFLIEFPRAGCLYPLFFDLDFDVSFHASGGNAAGKVSSPPPTATALWPLVRRFCAAVDAAYPGLSPKQRQCLVVFAGFTEKAGEHGASRYKSGVHLTFPGIAVDRDATLLVRRAVVVALEEAFPGAAGVRSVPFGASGQREMRLHNSIDDVVDIAVAKAPTQRMLFSNKLGFCAECKAQKGADACCREHYKGRVDMGRMEQLLWVVEGGQRSPALTQRYTQSPMALLKAASLRLGFGPHGTRGQTGVEPHNVDTAFHLARFAVAEGRDGAHGDAAAFAHGADLVSGSSARIVLNLLALYFEEEPADTVKFNKKSRAYTVRLRDSHCDNKIGRGHSHGSNGTYFVVSRDGGMAKRCFSQSEGPEAGGARLFCGCAEFQQAMPVPPRLYLSLFGAPFRRPPPEARQFETGPRTTGPAADPRLVETERLMEKLGARFKRKRDETNPDPELDDGEAGFACA